MKNSNKMKTHFYLVRHGQTDWNVERKIQGHLDIPLNDTGRAEAAKLAEELKTVGFSRCFSSDLKRAYETASILMTNHALHIHTDQRLRERNYAPWQGRRWHEFNVGHPDEKKVVESDAAMQQRALQLLNELLVKYSGEHILLVTHGGLLRNVLIHVLGLDCHADEIEAKNTSVLQLTHHDGTWKIQDLQGIILDSKYKKGE